MSDNAQHCGHRKVGALHTYKRDCEVLRVGDVEPALRVVVHDPDKIRGFQGDCLNYTVKGPQIKETNTHTNLLKP